MATGYAGMADFVSLQMGLIWVVGCVLLYVGTYLVGSKKGGRAAAKYTATVTWFFLVGLVGIIGFAFFIREASVFFESYPYTVIVEMLLLALGCVWIMWFMATQYSRGRIAIDERFGSKENYLRAKEAAKRASRNPELLNMSQQDVPVDLGAAVPANAVGVVADGGIGDPLTGIAQQDPNMPGAMNAHNQAMNPAGVPAGDYQGTNVMQTVDPLTGQALPGQAAPAVDAFGQPAVPAPVAPAPQTPVIDPATGQVLPPQSVATPMQAQAPAVDPLTGQALPGQAAPAVDAFGQPAVPAPVAPAPQAQTPVMSEQAFADQGQFAAVPDFMSQAMNPQAPPMQEVVNPIPLGASAPQSAAFDSNDQWLQQLSPAAVDPAGTDMSSVVPAGSFDPFAAQGMPPQVPAQGFPPPPAPAPGFDPFAAAPPAPPMPPMPQVPMAPAVDAFGQPVPPPAAPYVPSMPPQPGYGQAPPPAQGAPNPYGY